MFVLFFSYSAQFCSESVSWSQCLQCFVAAFLLWRVGGWVGRVYREVKRGKVFSRGNECCFSANVSALWCHYILEEDDSQSVVWTSRQWAFLFFFFFFFYFCYIIIMAITDNLQKVYILQLLIMSPGMQWLSKIYFKFHLLSVLKD